MSKKNVDFKSYIDIEGRKRRFYLECSRFETTIIDGATYLYKLKELIFKDIELMSEEIYEGLVRDFNLKKILLTSDAIKKYIFDGIIFFRDSYIQKIRVYNVGAMRQCENLHEFIDSFIMEFEKKSEDISNDYSFTFKEQRKVKRNQFLTQIFSFIAASGAVVSLIKLAINILKSIHLP